MRAVVARNWGKKEEFDQHRAGTMKTLSTLSVAVVCDCAYFSNSELDTYKR